LSAPERTRNTGDARNKPQTDRFKNALSIAVTDDFMVGKKTFNAKQEAIDFFFWLKENAPFYFAHGKRYQIDGQYDYWKKTRRTKQ
jgi:hypothetical protein